MNGFLRWFCRRLLVGALTLLAGGVLAPAAARAGCGDPVMTLPPTAGADAHTSAAAPYSAIPRETHPEPPRQPCSGPGCSRSPLAPAPTPVAPSAPTGQEWACVPALPAPPPLASSPDARADRRGPPLRAAATVYHPPR